VEYSTAGASFPVVSTKTNSLLTPESCAAALAKFWHEQLRVEAKGDRLFIGLPLLRPDGWQIVVTLQQISATRAVLSDRGETIAALENAGLDLEPSSLSRELLETRLKTFELIQDGLELVKEVKLPLDGLDVHLFGEALVSIAHLLYRHEPAKMRNEHVYQQVRGLLTRGHFKFVEGAAAVVAGRTEKQIGVDFLLNEKRVVACKSVERRGRVRDYMEQWGYRWMDAKKKNPKLVAAMFYDPENQQWDEGSLAIGKEVCEIFHPYYEAEAIQRDLKKFTRAA
jgi:hypothetical protein